MRRRALASLAICGVVVAACGKHSSETTVLQASDLSTDGDGPFDPNEIIDLASFTDYLGLDSDEVQAFLEATPYDRASFLSTYQSNGVLAVDAIARSAETYRLNPLVFLVRAEMAQGLIGQQYYPSPPSRVEYVFGCGCAAPGLCDPMLAGFDRQVDCLGNALRTSLDEIAQKGATAGGWAPGKPNPTIDGAVVTPADASTAALYQYLPEVGVGTGGNWLFWNIWQKYADAANYGGPAGPTNGMAAIGDACVVATDCSEPSSICATGASYPGGLCTLECTNGCPSDQTETFCADFQTTGYCLAVCNPTSPMPCRAGYQCIHAQHYGSTDPSDAQDVCYSQGQ